MLFSAAQETSSELANEVSRAAAAMSTTTTLLVTHKRVHCKALYPFVSQHARLMPKYACVSYAQSACPVASRAVAHASLSVTGFWA
jgi:hypothetical protein